MIKKLAVAVAVMAALPAAAWCQTECKPPYKLKHVLVQLDSTGISGWRFLNSRRPFAVVDPEEPDEGKAVLWEECAQKADVTFTNSASGQSLIVTLPYTYRRVDARVAAIAIEAQLVEMLQAIATAAPKTPAPGDAASLEAVVTDALKPPPDDKGGLVELTRFATLKLRRIGGELVNEAQEQTLQQAAESADKAQQATEKVRPVLIRAIARSAILRQKLAAWTKANPAADPTVRDAAKTLDEELQRLEAWLQEGLGVIESGSERPPLSECSDPTAESQTCRYQFTLFDNSSFTVPPDTWKRLVRFSDGTVRFSVRFFDEQFPASNTDGYLRVRTKVRERPSVTAWSLNSSVGYSLKPQSPRKRPENDESRPFTLADPYTGRVLDGFNGSARLELIQTLSERAKARVNAQFKEGALGEKDDTRTLTVPLYTVDVFGLNAASLRFGKYAMFQPARRIAINAVGEGFQLNVHNLSIGHIVTLESATGVQDDANQDSDVTVMRLSGAPGFSIFKHVDVFGLYGEKRRKKDTSYDYNTLGAQFFFANSPSDPQKDKTFTSFSGSVSYFHSDRDVGTAGTPVVVDGTGSVWLIDAGVTWLREAGASTKSLRTLGVLLGAGTGDDPKTTDKDESYLGETAGGFSGYESMFLSAFPSTLQDGTPARLPIGKGLANKSYVGINYVERAFKQVNLLWWLARAMQVEADVRSPATILRAHWFRLDQPFQEKQDAGFEAGLQWQIQVPEGVTTTLGCSRYYPGSATRRFFLVEPMSCSGQVTLTLQ